MNFKLVKSGWSHDEMRDAVRDGRRHQRELEVLGHAEGGPTDVVLAEMLGQLLDEVEADA